jgi:hypothetical protein
MGVLLLVRICCRGFHYYSEKNIRALSSATVLILRNVIIITLQYDNLKKRMTLKRTASSKRAVTSVAHLEKLAFMYT